MKAPGRWELLRGPQRDRSALFYRTEALTQEFAVVAKKWSS